MTEGTITLRKGTIKLLLGVIIAFVAGFLVGGNLDISIGPKSGGSNAGVLPGDGSAPLPGPSPVIDMEALADDDPVIGSPDAPVTMIEFSDFECPYCGRFFTDTLPELRRDYIDTGKVRLVYRDFPLYPRINHPNSINAAEAAECANAQGKFEQYHDSLFENQAVWSGSADTAYFKTLANELGLDTGKFNSCLDNHEKKAEVDKDISDGEAVGVSGTPTFFINGEKVEGAYPTAVFRQTLDALLG